VHAGPVNLSVPITRITNSGTGISSDVVFSNVRGRRDSNKGRTGNGPTELLSFVTITPYTRGPEYYY